MRRAAQVLSSILLMLLAGAALVLVVPILRGEPSRLVIVSGHSMDPTFHTGDLVLAWPGADYEVGDIAPYRVPEGEPGAGGLVIHRVVGGDGTSGYVMQGDNNPTPDIWMPRDEDIIGRKVVMVPRVGELMAWVRQPAVLAALIAGLVTAVAVSSALGRRRAEGLDDSDSEESVIDLRDPEPVVDLTTVDRPSAGSASDQVPVSRRVRRKRIYY